MGLSPMTTQPWLCGGGGDLFPDLTWTNRPDMTGSEAPEALQDAWVATMLSIKMMVGRVAEGSCFLVNLTAYPLVQRVLGETVNPCAGYGGFVGATRTMQIGHRWRPSKWADYIDGSASAHLRPLQDVHTWLETQTHIVDFTTGDTMGDIDGEWPPLIYWPKWKMPKHPRETRGRDGVTMLLWRNKEAAEMVIRELAPVVAPIIAVAAHILDDESARHIDAN